MTDRRNGRTQRHLPGTAAARLTEEGREIIGAIEEVKEQLNQARHRFDMATNETLMDSYTYEIIALTKKYEFFLKTAKELGLIAGGFQKIS